MTPAFARSGRIAGLDLLRVISIVLVVGYHMGYALPASLGVTVFFVISGFLITTLLLRELHLTGSISLKSFYRNRTFRIFPAFYAAWAGTMILALVRHQPLQRKNSLFAVFYLADYARAFATPASLAAFPLGQSWSLAIEEQFYLIWPLLLVLLLGRRRPLTWLSMAIVTLWGWRWLLLVSHVRYQYIYNAFDTRADAIFVGCWTALALRMQNTTPYGIALGRVATACTAAILITLGICEARMVGAEPGLTAVLTLAPPVAAVLIIQLAYHGGNDWTWVEHPAIRWLAQLSYSVYLTHGLALDLIGRQRKQHFTEAMLILVLASGSFYLIERPFLRLKTPHSIKGKEQDRKALLGA